MEANCTPTLDVNGLAIEIALPNAQANSAIIISKLENGSYKHNDATLLAVSAPSWTFDVAIDTYPIGQARLLNGGDFAGGEVNPSQPVVESYALTITKTGNPTVTVKVDGNDVVTGQSIQAGKTVNISFSNISPDDHTAATINGQAITLSGDDPQTGSFVMPAQASTLALSI